MVADMNNSNNHIDEVVMLPEIQKPVLEHLSGATLFYPCSGIDFETPRGLFAPYVQDFWFVDIGYFRQASPESPRRFLELNGGYEFLDVQMRLPNIPETEWHDDERYDSSPYVRTETYRHISSGRTVRIHLHKRRGPSALDTEIDKLGVFFYRGDSEGEGGSGTLWLTVHRKTVNLIDKVLDKLIDGGLIVTDGSNCDRNKNPYAELGKFYQKPVGCEAVKLAKPFEDNAGHRFQCIGYAGDKYGPTLVWQILKSEGHASSMRHKSTRVRPTHPAPRR
jgi:hypothetical protein